MNHSPVRMLALCLAACLLTLPALSIAESDAFTPNQTAVFEAVKWSHDFPKNAQVTNAIEYLCKVEDHQLHLMLLQLTQNETILSIQDNSSTLMLIDLDDGTTITYTNCVWPESPEITSKEDALNMLFSCWDSFTRGYNPMIFADHEITYPLSAEEIAAINTALTAHFAKPE